MPIAIMSVVFLVAFLLGFIFRYVWSSKRLNSAETKANKLIEESKGEIEKTNREQKAILLETRDEIQKERNVSERESRERRQDLQKLENRLHQREENIDKKSQYLEGREQDVNKKEKQVDSSKEEINTLLEKHKLELERVSGLTSDEAKKIIMNAVEEEARKQSLKTIENIERNAIETSEKKASEIIIQSIQRLGGEIVQDTSVTSVSLPGEEMKGRIIGREGRNIRMLETLTGVDIIIDDTPEAVVISCFDPVRKEIAKRSLEKLIVDGRIHPARIEEIVERTKRDVEESIMEYGETALNDLNISAVHPEIVRHMGRLKYRTSYGQNMLHHSKEVANICAIIAAELNANVELAKRAGFLHDIGKAISVNGEGTHTMTGGDLAKRYGESEKIVNAIAAHHGDIDTISVEAVIVKAADAISAARPGARRESFDLYVKRLENLERIADSFEGVEKAFAIQAGRELRVMVRNDNVDDDKAKQLARDIAKRIEGELKYPGVIRVTVIRELRVVEVAR